MKAMHPWKQGDTVLAPDRSMEDGLTKLVVYDTEPNMVRAIDPSLNLCLQWVYGTEGWTVAIGITSPGEEDVGCGWKESSIARYPGPNHWEEV